MTQSKCYLVIMYRNLQQNYQIMLHNSEKGHICSFCNFIDNFDNFIDNSMGWIYQIHIILLN